MGALKTLSLACVKGTGLGLLVGGSAGLAASAVLFSVARDLQRAGSPAAYSVALLAAGVGAGGVVLGGGAGFIGGGLYGLGRLALAGLRRGS